MRFAQVTRLREDRHPKAAPVRKHGRRVFKEAVQAVHAELPDVVWVDGVLLVVEP